MLLKPILLVTLSLLAFTWSADSRPRVANVIRQIPMTNQAPLLRDIIIQGAAGLEVGQKVGVVRPTAVRNMAMSEELGALNIPVGMLEIIFTQGELAVAREVEVFSREKMPLIEFMGIMVGDQIDISLNSRDTQSSRGRRR
jgi:hypothetical protein